MIGLASVGRGAEKRPPKAERPRNAEEYAANNSPCTVRPGIFGILLVSQTKY